MMRWLGMLPSRRQLGAGVGLLVMACVLSAAGCGGGTKATPEVTLGDSPDVGRTLQAQGWVVTLIEQPEQRKQVGTGAATSTGQGSVGEQGSESGARIADGLWLIVPIELTNSTGDMALLSKRLLTVTDAQGQEYQFRGREIHAPHIYSSERWGETENQLMQNPMDTGVTRQGPLIYDVPADATGLTLVMQGTDETIDLGF